MANANFNEQGYTGLSEWGGHIQDDFLRELNGIEAYKRFDEMRRNNAVVGALLSAIELVVRGVEWDATTDEGEDERTQLVDDALNNMTRSLPDHISEVLTMLAFGWCLFEIVYERDPRQTSRILWRKFSMRGQDTLDSWQFDDTGGLVAFKQSGNAQSGYKPVVIPIEKCLLYRTRVERNNPEGRSLLRTAWTSYYYLKNMQQIEAIGVERDLAGMPVVTLPAGADLTDNTTSDLGKARKTVRNIRRDTQEGVTLTDGWKLELLSTGGSRQMDVGAIIQRYESRILMSALAQFLILGQNSVGTQALSSDMSELFDLAVNSIADTIADVLTKYAIPRLLDLNGMDAQGVKITHSPSGNVDLARLGTFLQQASNWLTPTAQDEVMLRGLVGLPELDEETIQAERDAKAARAVALFQKQQPGAQVEQPQDKQPPEPKPMMDKMDKAPDQEQMTVDLFAGASSSDAERRANERKFYSLEAAYLAKLQKRLLKAARGMR